MGKGVVVGVTEDEDCASDPGESSRKKVEEPSRRDITNTLPKLSELDTISNLDIDVQTRTYSHIEERNTAPLSREHETQKHLSDSKIASDSVGSDTEHRSAGVKVTRMRKRRSDARSWGKEPDESETSSGHRPEKREANPYLKRYFQKQARAAEMRKYISEANKEENASFEDEPLSKNQNSHDRHSAKDKRHYSTHEDLHQGHHRRDVREDSEHGHHKRDANINLEHRHHTKDENDDYDHSLRRTDEHKNFDHGRHRRKSFNAEATHLGLDGHKRSHRRKSEVSVEHGDYSHGKRASEDISTRPNYRHSKTKSRGDREGKEGQGDFRPRRKSRCDCSPRYTTSVSPNARGHSHDEESPQRTGRKSSKQFLEVPDKINTASSEQEADKHYHHYHHHHHLHHHERPPLEKGVSIHEEDHHSIHHRRHHRKHHHRKKSRLREGRSLERAQSTSHLSDGEAFEREKLYSSHEEQRSRSEMSNFSRRNSQIHLSVPNTRDDSLTDDERDQSEMLTFHEEETIKTSEEPVEELRDEAREDAPPLKPEAHKQEEEAKKLQVEKKDYAIQEDLPSTGKEHYNKKMLGNEEDAISKTMESGTDPASIQTLNAQIKTQTAKMTLVKEQEIASKDRSPRKKNGRILQRKASISRRNSKSRSRSPVAKISKEGIRKVTIGTKKAVPRREGRKTFLPKQLKPTQSMPEILPKTTAEEILKQKSQSATSPKSSELPRIRLCSAEGDYIDLLLKDDMDSQDVGKDRLSDQSNKIESVSDKASRKIERQVEADTTTTIGETHLESSKYSDENRLQRTHKKVKETTNERDQRPSSAKFDGKRSNANDETDTIQERHNTTQQEYQAENSENENDDGSQDQDDCDSGNLSSQNFEVKDMEYELKRYSSLEENVHENSSESPSPEETPESQDLEKKEKRPDTAYVKQVAKEIVKEVVSEAESIVSSEQASKSEETDLENTEETKFSIDTSSSTKTGYNKTMVGSSQQLKSANKVDREDAAEITHIADKATEHGLEEVVEKREKRNTHRFKKESKQESAEQQHKSMLKHVRQDIDSDVDLDGRQSITQKTMLKQQETREEVDVADDMNGAKVQGLFIPVEEDNFSGEESSSEAETKFQSDDSEEVHPQPDLTDLVLATEEKVGLTTPLRENDKRTTPEMEDHQKLLSDIRSDSAVESVFEAEVENGSGVPPLSLSTYEQPEEAEPGVETTLVKDKHSNGHENTHRTKDIVPSVQSSDKGMEETEELIKEETSPKLVSELNNLSSPLLHKTSPNEHLSQNVPSEESIYFDIGSQTFIVKGETEFYRDPEEHRSISVQTVKAVAFLDVPSKAYKKKRKSMPSKQQDFQKTIAIQTEEASDIQDKGTGKEETNLLSISDTAESKSEDKVPSTETTQKLSKNDYPSYHSSTKSSPERHNPSAVFYTVNTDHTEPQAKNQEKIRNKPNPGALFDTAPIQHTVKDTHQTRKPFNRQDSKETFLKAHSNQQSGKRLQVRSITLDRSMESERSVAIANSAFRKLNSKGELTVFNSTPIIPSLDLETGKPSTKYDKPPYQRRGEYSNLEKPGFLWVHFGSGSSPIHTLRRKPNFTSQRTKREVTHKQEETKSAKKEINTSSSQTVGRQKQSVQKSPSKKVDKSIAQKTNVTRVQKKEPSPSKIAAPKVKVHSNKPSEQPMKAKEFLKRNQNQKHGHGKDSLNSNKTHLTKGHPQKHPEDINKSSKTNTTEKSGETSASKRKVCQETTAGEESSNSKQTNQEFHYDDNPKRSGRERESSVKRNEEQHMGDFNGRTEDPNKDDRSNGKEDDMDKKPRLSETAKSSSFEEGDVRLVIERKVDPGISIKIKMKDRNKSKGKSKSTDMTDWSSAQGESDQSYMKDSGYISTSESIHKHRRSITIDLGHTTAKINAGMKTSSTITSNGHVSHQSFLPSVNDNVAVLQSADGTKSSHRVQKTMPSSKLPILGDRRQRSNSLVFMDYNRSPRRDSMSGSEMSVISDIHYQNSMDNQGMEGRSIVKTLQVGKDKESLSSNIHRQTAHGNGRTKVVYRRSNIPIYKAYSDGNLHKDYPSPRLQKHSLSTPSIYENGFGRKLQSSERKMSSIKELSSSPSELRHSDTELDLKSAEKIKLPSILLYEPSEDSHSSRKETDDTFPKINTKPSRHNIGSRSSSKFSSKYSSENGLSSLPLLQTPVRCRCSILPHKYWDERRSRSAVDCVANVHFLTEEELAEFDSRFFSISGRSSASGGGLMKKPSSQPVIYRALRTQALKRLNSGRLSADKSVTFHVDHQKERNTFKLPTEKLEKNKKWQVVFTIGKTDEKQQSTKENKK